MNISGELGHEVWPVGGNGDCGELGESMLGVDDQ